MWTHCLHVTHIVYLSFIFVGDSMFIKLYFLKFGLFCSYWRASVILKCNYYNQTLVIIKQFHT